MPSVIDPQGAVQNFSYDREGRNAARQAEAENMYKQQQTESSAKTSGAVGGALSGAATGAALGMAGGPLAPLTVPGAALLGGVLGGASGYLSGGAQTAQTASNVGQIAKAYQDERGGIPQVDLGVSPNIQPLTMPKLGGN